ncbi:unnamed protein product, partial [Prorocentrum cordatum]
SQSSSGAAGSGGLVPRAPGVPGVLVDHLAIEGEKLTAEQRKEKRAKLKEEKAKAKKEKDDQKALEDEERFKKSIVNLDPQERAAKEAEYRGELERKKVQHDMEKLSRDCQTKTRAFRGAVEIEVPNVCATLAKRNFPQETAAHLKSESATGSPSKADMAKWMELATAESRDLILLFKNFCKRTCRGDFKKVTDQADERATTTA